MQNWMLKILLCFNVFLFLPIYLLVIYGLAVMLIKFIVFKLN